MNRSWLDAPQGSNYVPQPSASFRLPCDNYLISYAHIPHLAVDVLHQPPNCVGINVG